MSLKSIMMTSLMSGIERKPSRREFLKKSVLNLIFVGAGLETGKMITVEELQRQTNLQLDQAQRIVDDALAYTAKVERYDEKIKVLIPSLVIRFYSPSKDAPFVEASFYGITTSMIKENDEFLDKISEAVALLTPPSFLKFRKIDLVIQDVKLPDRPKKPLSLVEIANVEPFIKLERTD